MRGSVTLSVKQATIIQERTRRREQVLAKMVRELRAENTRLRQQRKAICREATADIDEACEALESSNANTAQWRALAEQLADVVTEEKKKQRKLELENGMLHEFIFQEELTRAANQ